MTNNKSTLIPFLNEQQIRKIYFEDEWWFSILDVITFFADVEDTATYWEKVKKKEKNTSAIDLSTICRHLKLTASDGKKYATDCANTEGIFRIIQSIPSPKAEPFKMWLARIGKERIDEIENPELGVERAKSLYEKKGYDKKWIDKRMRGIAVRQTLTDEWAARGAKKAVDFAILTNDIMQGAFDLKVNEYKKPKAWKKKIFEII